MLNCPKVWNWEWFPQLPRLTYEASGLIWKPGQTPDQVIPLLMDTTPVLIPFLRLDSLQKRMTEWKSEFPKGAAPIAVLLERSYNLMNKRLFRNQVCAIEAKVTFEGDVQFKGEEPFRVSLNDWIPFATQLEELSDSNHIFNVSRAFAVGGVVDHWAHTLKKNQKKEALQWLQKTWPEFTGFLKQLGDKIKNDNTIRFGEEMGEALIYRFLGESAMYALYPKELDAGSYAKYLTERAAWKYNEWSMEMEQMSKRFEVFPEICAQAIASGGPAPSKAVQVAVAGVFDPLKIASQGFDAFRKTREVFRFWRQFEKRPDGFYTKGVENLDAGGFR